MDTQAAQWTLYGIAAVGAFVWIAGLRFLRKSFLPQGGPQEGAEDRFERTTRAPGSTIEASSRVPEVQYTGPSKPSRRSRGRYPP